jgi:uncharacterized membrane protein YebE (DUF533 family)
MFDAKSLLEMMMKGAGGQQAGGHQAGSGAGGQGGLGDLLGQLSGMLPGGQAGGSQSGAGQSASGQPSSGMGGLGDLLGKLGGGGANPGQQAGGQPAQGGGLEDLLRQFGGGGAQPGGQQANLDAGAAGGMGDMLKKLQEQLGGAGGVAGAAGAAGAAGGGLMDMLGKVLGQATSGVQDGARKVDEMTGASGRMRDMTGQVTGQSPDDIMTKLKDLISQNQMAAGAGLGGLGALVLGTKTGRGMATSVAKIGGLALIGGLAYKALQNYQSGKPLISSAADVSLAPTGSGYEPQCVTNDSATLYIRAMISAAAADGRIDPKEHERIMGGLKQAGAGAEAEQFFAQELNNPASIDELVAGVKTQEEAVQLFTAARIAIDLDNGQEQQFLVSLAQGLGLDGQLVNHIDAAARGQA